MADSPPDHEPSIHTRRTRRGIVWISLTVVFVLWVGLVVAQVRSAYTDTTAARDLLEEFKAETSASMSKLDLLTERPDLTKALDARRRFSDASSKLHSPLLAPLQVVPVLGRQIRVAAVLSDSGATLISTVASSYDRVTAILDELQAAPASERIRMRADTVQRLSRSLGTVVDTLDGLDTGTSEGLVGALWRARSQFIENRRSLVESMRDAIDTLDGVHAFLRGPNTYVVLAANNSEMRAGSGMFLQVSSLSAEDGRFEVGPFEATGPLMLSEPADTLDPDLERVWAGFYPTSEWRNINLTPRFDVSGRVAARMWRAMGNPEPDGTVAVDVRALERLLSVVGPVEVAGPDGTPVTLDSDNVTKYLLLDQYTTRSADGELVDRDDRRSSLGEVARAAFEALNGEDIGIEDLMTAFTDMGNGRHLLMWSSDPVQQSAWRALGVSGELQEKDLLVSLINRGANKLDQFIEMSVDLTERRSGDSRSIGLDVTMTNSAPGWLPPYVAGSTPVTGVAPGDYIGYLTLNLPRGAHSISVTGAELVARADDGPTRLAVIKTIIPREEDLSVHVGFEMHESWRSLRVLPSARLPVVTWRYGSTSWADHVDHEVALDGTG